jgi:hypothetical protein
VKSGIGHGDERAGIGCAGADGGANRNRAHQQGRGEYRELALEGEASEHLKNLPFGGRQRRRPMQRDIHGPCQTRICAEYLLGTALKAGRWRKFPPAVGASCQLRLTARAGTAGRPQGFRSQRSQSKEINMFGKLLAAYVGEKMFARGNRGASGALGGVATAAVARRGAKPLALLLAAGYGLKLLNDYRTKQRASAA